MAVAENGDFADFYAATFRVLTIQLYAYTGDLSEAQDVVQEAFSRRPPRRGKLAGYAAPAAWVRRVAWNPPTSGGRRARRLLELTRHQRPEPVAGPSPDRIALMEALSTLPPRHRQAVVLHYLSDLPVNEIADITGVAEGTVKSWLHRARAALATRMADWEPAGRETEDV
ncbi:SigE family RNA polymerase sigma factor [Micromonospora sp. CPCC 205371]|nr:SigE family RNA polymerase sigma factor [Micromonospora sp. CPCC 205371]